VLDLTKELYNSINKEQHEEIDEVIKLITTTELCKPYFLNFSLEQMILFSKQEDPKEFVLWCDEQAMLALNSTGGFSPENYIM
jgi:hypothetical protein